MIKVRISEDALQDLNDGFLFYEAQEADLGTTLSPVYAWKSKA